MRALDVFCGAGGAALGLKRAGFHVTGVDIEDQPRYCGDVFVRMDALEFLATRDLSEYNLIWASPPCQDDTILRFAPGKHRVYKLIGPTRDALMRTGKPYIIENVVGAPLVNPITLCGTSFGLKAGGYELHRHRLFEASFLLTAPECRHSGGLVVGVYGGHFRCRKRPAGKNHQSGSNVPRAIGHAAMGIDWMTTAEISDAIPPAFSKFVAEQWLRSRPPQPKQTEKPKMNDNPYREMAASVRGRTGFEGTILLFNKGEWTAGKVPMNDQELIALVPEAMSGWCKWRDGRPVDYYVGFVRDRYKPPKRDELGDIDASKWEKRSGERKDPWQFTYYLPLVDPRTGQLYIFSTTTQGGKDAWAGLLEDYADSQDRQDTVGKLPRVALCSETYDHWEYGKVHKPTFKILGCEDLPPGVRPIRPPVSAALAIEYGAGATSQIEHKPLRSDDDEIPF
jgi:DNA (cytosine-5)-methyltransferase 1